MTCAVSIGPREAGGFGLAVKLEHRRPDRCRRPNSKQFVNEAHEKICPYSHATRGNVDIDLHGQGRLIARASRDLLTERAGSPARNV